MGGYFCDLIIFSGKGKSFLDFIRENGMAWTSVLLYFKQILFLQCFCKKTKVSRQFSFKMFFVLFTPILAFRDLGMSLREFLIGLRMDLLSDSYNLKSVIPKQIIRPISRGLGQYPSFCSSKFTRCQVRDSVRR